MAKKYVFVRMPEETFNLFKVVNQKQNQDLAKKGIFDKEIPMPFTFRSVIDPSINENFIQIDFKNLIKNAKRKHI